LGNHQWDIPKLKELLEKIIPEKNSFDNYEVEHTFSSIGKRVMLLNARQVESAFGIEKVILLAIEDITERRGKEDSLKETHRATSEFLNNLLNHMHAPIIVWDTSMLIQRFNMQFELLSGYKAAEVIDKKIDFLFPKDKIASTLELLKIHLDDYHEVTEVDILTKDKNIKTVLWNSSRILDEEGKSIVATISQDITSRKLTEKALISSELRFRRLFESAQNGILCLDAETGRIVDVNPYLIDLLGYPQSELLEKLIWEIDSFSDIFEKKKNFVKFQKEEYVRYDDLPLVTSDGRKINVEFVSNVFLCDSIKVIQINIRDITERKKIQKELKFHSELINNVGQAVIATDLLGNVIFWNNAAKRIYGWSPDEAIGQNIVNLTPARQSSEQAIEIMKYLSEGNTWSGEFEVQRKDGSSFPAFVTDTPMLDSNGNLTGIIGISSDISERKLAETELIEAKEKAEESDRLKTAFLHNISHEIRTPLNAIVGFSDFLNDPGLTEINRKEFTKMILQGSDQLLAIIDDIISLASIEAGLEKIQKTNINLNEIFRLIKDQFSLIARNKSIDISINVGLSDNEAYLFTDGTKLTQILNNLVNNALKFTSHGYISCGYVVKDEALEFYVEDSGIGIPKEMHELIFSRFRQVETSNEQLFGGSGIGLSISKAYVEMLGGRIWLTSELGKGSVFYFSIPFTKVKQPILPKKPAPKELHLEFIRNKTLLVAEDDQLSFLFLNELLSNAGLHIVRAVNGVEAVEMCKSNPHIDLVLMDIKMPKMDGYEATKFIKKLRPSLPIIALTAYSTDVDRDKAFACGCSDFISKPVKKELLFLKIKEQLRK
jgi:PAS domain S-box-containing protein